LLSNDDFESNLMDDVTNGWLPEQYPKSKEAKLECNQYLNYAGDYMMIP
jgi:hypothetical protein